MNTKILQYSCALCLFLSHSAAYGQESTFKAMFTLNFAKYVIWPPQTPGPFIIAILGDDPVYEELKGLGPGAKIRGRTVSVTRSPSLDKIDNCNLLYISPDKSNCLATALAKFSARNTLIVTNKEGLARLGACINLISSGGKLTFEINEKNLKNAGLGANPDLFKLGCAIPF